MAFETRLTFAVAFAALLVVPGPDDPADPVLRAGSRLEHAMPLALGVALGDFTAMTLSLLGVGALLTSSAALFTVLKWMGAAYLVGYAWLGARVGRFASSPRAVRLVSRAGGSALIGAGAAAALTRA